MADAVQVVVDEHMPLSVLAESVVGPRREPQDLQLQRRCDSLAGVVQLPPRYVAVVGTRDEVRVQPYLAAVSAVPPETS